MLQRVRLPEAYLLARASIEDRGLWLETLLRVRARVLSNLDSIEVVDEEPASEAGDLAGVVIKITMPLSAITHQQLLNEVRAHCPHGVTARLIFGAAPEEINFDPSELMVEHFRREFSMDSQMVFHGESCTKLTHLVTGKSARSTAHRSRLVNDREALLLLVAILKAERHAA